MKRHRPFAMILGLFVIALGLGVYGISYSDPSGENRTVPTENSAVVPSQTAPAPPSQDPFKHAPPSNEELDRLIKSGYASVVRVDRVIVPAVVTDKKGRPIQGLTQKDFQLTENNVPQKIDYFHVDAGEKVSIAFLLDVSSSMRLMDKIGEAHEAILYFLTRLGAGDRASLMIFADGEVQQLAPFGTNPQAIIHRLGAIKAYGQTALNDAIAAAPSIVDTQEGGRKAIVLITDGVDNASKLSLYEAMASARRVDVPIYAIGFAGSVETQAQDAQGTNAEVLKLISEETGGNFFWINDPDEMKEAIHSVEEDLRSQYVLGYTPPQRCDGMFHRIELKSSHSRYRIRTRKGYVAGPC